MDYQTLATRALAIATDSGSIDQDAADEILPLFATYLGVQDGDVWTAVQQAVEELEWPWELTDALVAAYLPYDVIAPVNGREVAVSVTVDYHQCKCGGESEGFSLADRSGRLASLTGRPVGDLGAVLDDVHSFAVCNACGRTYDDANLGTAKPSPVLFRYDVNSVAWQAARNLYALVNFDETPAPNTVPAAAEDRSPDGIRSTFVMVPALPVPGASPTLTAEYVGQDDAAPFLFRSRAHGITDAWTTPVELADAKALHAWLGRMLALHAAT